MRKINPSPTAFASFTGLGEYLGTSNRRGVDMLREFAESLG